LFSFSSPQTIFFGCGQSQKTASLAKDFGNRILLVHGSNAQRAEWLLSSCTELSLTVKSISCKSEPTLPDIETSLAQAREFSPHVILALGGGSVIDFAKSLAALIGCRDKPIFYLEGVGDGRPLDNPPIPIIALPTTAGTGAEVTKNAVISVPEHGVKVSLRDSRMVPKIAIVDPILMQGAPRNVALSAGLDAITQVIEPYLSSKANLMTDALCHAAIPVGLEVIRDLVENDTLGAWESMAWVSTCGGLALANAGLGAVHGFAGVIGGKTNAPHGEICGALLPAVMESHINKADHKTDIYRRITWVLEMMDTHFSQGRKGCGLVELRDWSKKMGIRGMTELGLSNINYSTIAAAAANTSSMRGNPFILSQSELLRILDAAR
jgi:alcohol dehydrogenase class IV